MPHLRTSPWVVRRQPRRLAHDGNGLRGLRCDPRRAIHEEEILCLICGAPLRQLTNTHLQSHGTTALAYKLRFGYNLRRALMCLALRRLYAERAIQQGLAAAIRSRPILSEPELRRRGGFSPMALEESLTRREAWLRRKAAAAKMSRGRAEGQRGNDRAVHETIRAQSA